MPRHRRFRRGLEGLDALIILIALILVAAVVGAALINTSSTLMNKDKLIEKEKEKGIQQPIIVDSVRGLDENDDKRLDAFVFVVRMRAGDDPVDLNDTFIMVNTKATNCSKISYGLDEGQGCNYTVSYAKRGPNFEQDRLNLGDMVEMKFSGPNVIAGLEDNSARFNFIPSHGMATEIKVTIPERIKQKNLGLWPIND